MIDVFLNLLFELIQRSKWSIIANDIHDIYTKNLSVNISVKIDNMDFEMSFFDLV